MLVATTGIYHGTDFGFVLGSYKFTHYLNGLRGSGALPGPAPTNPSALTGMMAFITNSGITFSLLAAPTRAPWITGTVTVKNYAGLYS